MIDAGRHGAVSWVDLSTPDVASATDFYRELLGWSIEAMTTPMGDYSIATVGDTQVAGLMAHGPEQQGMPALWATFFTVEGMDFTLASVERAGGKLLQAPFEIPGDATVAVIEDPTGAMLCLIAGPQPGAPFLSTRPGSACWVELLTRDPDAAAGFYNEVFGWKAHTFDGGPAPYTMFRLDDVDVAGMMLMPAEVPAEAPAHWAVYFAVADCADTEHRVAALDGTVLRPTSTIEIGRFAVVADRQGATFQLMEYAE